jgi:hypothetical protein
MDRWIDGYFYSSELVLKYMDRKNERKKFEGSSTSTQSLHALSSLIRLV